MDPPQPASNDAPKRNGGAPQQLAKLDLETERQKSAKHVVAKPQADKQKPKAHDPHENATATKKKKPTSKDKHTGKASKHVKVAVASADQFSDIGDLSTAPPGSKGKPRPASADIKPAKISVSSRRASVGEESPSKTLATVPGGLMQKSKDGASSKPAFMDTTQRGDDNEAVSEGDENDERSLGKKDAETEGLYGVFVQTRRCEKLCYEVGLKLKHIRKIKRKFDDNDMYHTGEITQAEFFFIIDEERRPLTKGILHYANVAPDQKFLNFDEFLLCIVAFAVLTPPEVHQYAFDLYDADQSGTLDEYEFAKMSKEMQSKQFSFPKNTQMAINMIGGKDTSGKHGSGGGGGGYVGEDGLVDLAQFMRFTKLFPVAFFPLFNFQKNVRKATLGETKWSQLASRKLKIQELVSHMRRNFGEIPDLSFGARLWSMVDDQVTAVRKRAAEIYLRELNQRCVIGEEHGE